MELKRGTIVSDFRWPEPLEIRNIEECGDQIHIEGVLLRSKRHIDQLLSREEFAALSPQGADQDFSASPDEVFLALEARRYRLASLFDPLLAVNVSKVDPLPHQIDAVYGRILQLPRIRFLIADDPGAGKTIMAGLVIKELKLRHLVRRILVVTPGHLKDQWRRELADRFEEHFVVVDRGTVAGHYGENVWQREAQIITSMDFAKRDDVLPALRAVDFDLVIVDEAHKMSAYQYGDKVHRTSRYRLGEILSERATHLLFLTATPHKGDPDNFRLFLDLLEPGFFGSNELIQESLRSGDNPLFIRRLKEDLKDFDGRPLFLPRTVHTISFDIGADSPEEKELYNDLSRYVEEQYNKALRRGKRRSVAFALVILQRRFASSLYALHQSLERRKKRLEEWLEEGRKGMFQPRQLQFDWESWEETEDLEEQERWREEERIEALSVAENRSELEEEIRTLSDLLNRARKLIDSGAEIKLRRFRKALNRLLEEEPDEKVLVFTESRDTLEYIEKRLRSWGYDVCTIHGGMSLDQRIEGERIFRNRAQIMVATEAAGEGINLQFCHLMINYDLPWNPTRLEQRMGRIHRYGQQREVHVFNMVAADTREGRVFRRLFDKLDEIRRALGSDRVFDVLGEVYSGKNLAQLIVEAAANARSIEEILREIDVQVDSEYVARVRENLGESLATRYIDYTRIRELAERAREQRLIPEYAEAFFIKGFTLLGGKMRRSADGWWRIDRIPAELRSVADEDAFRRRFGPIVPRYPKATFDKDKAFRAGDAEFLSFGHPLFEALIEWIERTYGAALRRGTVFTDPDGRLDGTILLYECSVDDGFGHTAGRRMFASFVDARTNEIHPVNPAILWDLRPQAPPNLEQAPDVDSLRKAVLPQIAQALDRYLEEIRQERERQTAVKEKYGLKSLDLLITQLDGEIIDLEIRRENGEKVDLPLRNKQERKQRYEQARKELEETIARERNLSKNMPEFVAAVRVFPDPAAAREDAAAPDADIEAVGMRIALEYERAQGRIAEDVAAENLGFDIRSTDPETGAKRYIEVKARAGAGAVALTRNEWFKAHRFGNDYYLYVVLHAAGTPDLYIVRNPAACLDAEELVEVRYRFRWEDVIQRAVRAVRAADGGKTG